MADEHEPGRIEETALPILNNGFAAGVDIVGPAELSGTGIPARLDDSASTSCAKALGIEGMARNGVLFAYQQLLAEGFLEASPQGTRVARLATDRLGRKAFAAPAAEHIAHAHFRCEACGRIFCLDAPPPAAPELPAGFRLARMEVDLHGQCPACAAAQP